MTGPSDDRRRAERVYFEPLRVRVYGTREGILVDLSEGGALVLFPTELAAGRDLRLQIEWKDRTIQVDARVKRCLAHPVRLASATLARTHYDVALEFVNAPADTTAAIREILKSNSEA